jgi:group I intron endonuclease
MQLYLVTNKISGKKYVGQTVNPLSVRWSQHIYAAIKKNSRTVLHKAIRKYGSENFEVRPIASANTRAELDIMEIEAIGYMGTHYLDGHGYNMSLGGEAVRNGWKETAEAAFKRTRNQCKEIFCWETGEVFPSIVEAASYFGISSTFLSQVVSGRKASVCGKFHFLYLNDEMGNLKAESRRAIKSENSKKHFVTGRPVVCVSTGITYPSVKSAARETGTVESNLTVHLSKLRPLSNGLFFQYRDKFGELI